MNMNRLLLYGLTGMAVTVLGPAWIRPSDPVEGAQGVKKPSTR